LHNDVNNKQHSTQRRLVISTMRSKFVNRRRKVLYNQDVFTVFGAAVPTSLHSTHCL